MNEFKSAKEEYLDTPIPAELSDRVRAGIRQGRENRRKARRAALRRSIGTLAACFAVLVGTLNLSPTVAAAAADVPVLGGLFQVLTVRHYEKTEDGVNYQVTVPEVEGGGTLADRVNDAIQEKVDAHLEKARQDWEEYRDAFFATGGTEEEWGGREMDVIADYEVKSQTDTRVSFVVTLAEGWVSSLEERYYYNLDLAEDRSLTLRDLLGDNWVETCNAAVEAYIADQTDKDGFSYFFAPEEGGFTTVDENTTFYIREDGVVVVAFPRYSIAAGAAGIVEIPVV
nr:RsiV family protein [uncultured Dysosmobacter sp.]